MNLFNHIRPQRPRLTTESFGVGYFVSAHARELPVHKIGSDLPFDDIKTPVADVFEQ